MYLALPAPLNENIVAIPAIAVFNSPNLSTKSRIVEPISKNCFGTSESRALTHIWLKDCQAEFNQFGKVQKTALPVRAELVSA